MNEAINTYIPKRIKQARTMRGMTLLELGNKVGLSKGTLSRYESGDIQTVRRGTINAIALALDVDPLWLMGETDDPNITEGEKSVLRAFGDMETQMVRVVGDNVSALGVCLAEVATNQTVFDIVVELSRMDSTQRELVLKMIRGMNA